MSPSRPDLSVTIASFNACAALRRCLRSLFLHRGEIDMEVIVVDNASADGSPEMIEREFPAVRLIGNSENRFLTGAQNQAIALSTGRFILILNSDMEVVAGTLPTMVRYMDAHPEVGASSCLEILHGAPKVPLMFQSPLQAAIRRTFLRKLLGVTTDHFVNPHHERGLIEAEVVSDAFMVVRREALDRIGRFDEAFKLYYTEDDLCMRFHAAGWKVHYVPGASVTHIGEGSHSVRSVSRLKILRINYHDTWCYFRKHHGSLAGLAVYAVLLLQYALLDLPRLAKQGLTRRVMREPERGVS